MKKKERKERKRSVSIRSVNKSIERIMNTLLLYIVSNLEKGISSYSEFNTELSNIEKAVVLVSKILNIGKRISNNRKDNKYDIKDNDINVLQKYINKEDIF